ncbi:MAG: DNA alkylation repair protein [Blastocatellia bacterium]
MNEKTVNQIRKSMRRLGSRERAELSQRYFKTGPGQYGEGDIFLGLNATELKGLASEHRDLAMDDLLLLLKSTVHEERMLALMILVRAFTKGDSATKKRIYETYLEHTRFINNWDLVDASAQHIVGHFLMDKSRKPLYALARSGSMWERRIAIISTFWFIRQNQITDTLRISKLLISDKEDLIHKAVGWMLREGGKRDLPGLESFLKEHYKKMPRTMLRYAIEKFSEPQRQLYLKGQI